MDTNKLLQILNLVDADEKENLIQQKIEEIRNLVSQNSPDSGVEASEKTTKLIEIIKATRASKFTVTEREILEGIGAEFYFGEGLIDSLNDILMTRSFEVAGRLKSFHHERQSMYLHLTQLKTTLEELGVEAYQQVSPEIGLKLPDELLSIDEVSIRLKEFSHLLKAIQEPLRGKGGVVGDVKITRMNKGSGEFFFGVSPEVALLVLNILSDLATVVATAHQIKNSNPVKDNKYVSPEDTKRLKELVEDIADKTIQKFIEEVPGRIANDIKPEQANSIKKHVQILFKWIPLGIHFEVVYDKEVDPVSGEDGDVEKTARLENEKQMQLERVRQMYKLPLKDITLLEGEVGKEIDVDDKKWPKSF